jgi:phytol kinase
MLQNNLLATGVTLALALLWLRCIDALAHRGIISSPLSRKIIHIGTGPIFVLCWVFFNNDPIARYLAALVPLGITVQFFLIGTGLIKDQASVDAMSRSGDRREILRGPFFYGIAFILLTIVFWKESLIGMVALMILCGGDGFADVIGKRIPSSPVPWSVRKTLAGSAAMFLGSFIISLLVVWVYTLIGTFQVDFASFTWKLGLICLACTGVESLPIKDIDNITVPVTAVLLGFLLF